MREYLSAAYAWVVRSGLKAGERVITDGVMKIGPGAPVSVAPAGGAALPGKDAPKDAPKTDAKADPTADSKSDSAKNPEPKPAEKK